MTRINAVYCQSDHGDIPSRATNPPSDSVLPAHAEQRLPDALQGLKADPAESNRPSLPRRMRMTTLSDSLVKTPHDKYAFELSRYEWQFNGNRPHERLLSRFPQSSLHGGSPFWDIDARTIAENGCNLTSYGNLIGSPFEAPDGKIRVRLHYADKENAPRMTAHFGPPTGHEPALMRNSYRSVQIQTPSGWEQFKFSMPDDTRFGFDVSHKQLTPANIEAAVQFSAALQGDPAYIREPAGIVLSLNGDGPLVTQLWREMPVASRGFKPGDFVAPIHVLTDPAFADSERGQAIFGVYMEGKRTIKGARASWLLRELAPKLADILMNVLTDTFAHPQLHEQNAEVVIDADGHVLDVLIKDLSDIALDHRAIAAAGQTERWRGVPVNDMAHALPNSNDLQFPSGTRYTVERFYQAFFGSIGTRVMESTEQPLAPSAMIEHATALLMERVYHWLPEAWRQKQRHRQTYEGAFGRAATTPYKRIANLRELIIEYLEERNDKQLTH